MVWDLWYGSIAFSGIFGVVVGPSGMDPLLVIMFHIVVATRLQHSFNRLLERYIIIRTTIGLRCHHVMSVSKVNVP